MCQALIAPVCGYHYLVILRYCFKINFGNTADWNFLSTLLNQVRMSVCMCVCLPI